MTVGPLASSMTLQATSPSMTLQATMPKSAILPAEILVPSTMAGGAADFLAELGVSSTIKSVVGLEEGLAVGKSLGFDEGLVVGESMVGFDEGLAVGESLGFDEGLVVGESVGFDLGIAVGEGLAAGVSVGFDQGIAVGEGLAVDVDSSSDSSSSSSDDDDDSSSSSLDCYDQHKDYCEVCGQPGFLLCCATCSIVSHLHCAGLQEEPLNAWMCNFCLANDNPSEGQPSGNDEVEISSHWSTTTTTMKI